MNDEWKAWHQRSDEIAAKQAEVERRQLAIEAKFTKALASIADERATHAGRGWTAEHDAEHGVDHLVELAVGYAQRATIELDVRRKLVKAASLLVAAIDLLDQEADDDA